ncbi:hypothetical protein [Nocardia beijingensis]
MSLRAAATLTELSALESRFGLGKFDTDQHSDRYTELRRLVRAGADGPREPRGLGPDAEQWLAEHGWRIEFRAWDDLVAPLDRPAALQPGSRIGSRGPPVGEPPRPVAPLTAAYAW